MAFLLNGTWLQLSLDAALERAPLDGVPEVRRVLLQAMFVMHSTNIRGNNINLCTAEVVINQM